MRETDFLSSVQAEFRRVMSEEYETYRSHQYTRCIEGMAVGCMDERFPGYTQITNLPPEACRMYCGGGGQGLYDGPIQRRLQKVQARGGSILLRGTYHRPVAHQNHSGCRAFGYDTEEAIRYHREYRDQFLRHYSPRTIYPVLIGIDLTTHGFWVHAEQANAVFRVSQLAEDLSLADAVALIADYLPSMPDHLRQCFAWDIVGNRQVITRRQQAKALIEHCGSAVVVSRLLKNYLPPGLAYVVHPDDPRLDLSVATAATLIGEGIREERIPLDEIPCLVSLPDMVSTGRRTAQEMRQALCGLTD